MKKELSFALEDVVLYEEDESADFAVAKLYFLAEGNNSHKNPISLDVLKRDANTALGKFIIAKYNQYTNDVGGHEDDETIVGYIPPNSSIDFKEKDGKTFAVAEGVISKLYAKEVYDLFKSTNNRSVSCEFSANMEFEEDTLPFGADNPILGFVIRGITILGKNINPSCAGANIQIVKFSEKEAENFYNNYSINTILEFAEKRRGNAKTYKVNKSELKDTPWGDVDKTILRNKILETKNKAAIVKDVYALVEEGWEEAPSQHLKYPLMELVGDTLYYNRGALSSALGYAKKENETSVVSKVEKLYKKFNLDGKEEEKTMAKKEFSAIEIGNLWGNMYDILSTKYPDADYGSVYRIEGIYEENNQKFAIIKKKDEVVKYRLNFDITEDKLNISDEIIEVKIDILNTEEVKKFEEPQDCEKFTTFKKDEKFSLDVNADVGAFLQMLIDETEDNKALANELWESKDLNVIMAKFIEVAKERDELKSFKEQKEEEEKRFQTEKEETAKKLEVEEMLEEVKEDIPEDKVEEIKEKGMACKYSEINSWKNSVKAFAYENSKKESKENFKRISFSQGDEDEKELTADKIYKKYL